MKPNLPQSIRQSDWYSIRLVKPSLMCQVRALFLSGWIGYLTCNDHLHPHHLSCECSDPITIAYWKALAVRVRWWRWWWSELLIAQGSLMVTHGSLAFTQCVTFNMHCTSFNFEKPRVIFGLAEYFLAAASSPSKGCRCNQMSGCRWSCDTDAPMQNTFQPLCSHQILWHEK